MKQQKITRDQPKRQPIVHNLKTPKLPEPQDFDPAIANQPVRTVIYVEVGDLDATRVQLLLQEVNRIYENAKGGIHYVIPTRHGKPATDIIFEQQILEMVRKICKVVDGEIVFREDARDVRIIRESV